MRFLYSNAHPSDRLAGERAGHVVRAAQLLAALERAGHGVTVVESAAAPATALAAGAYHGVGRRLLGERAGGAARDAARIVANRRFARRLLATARQGRFDAIVETHVGFSRAGASVAAATGIPLVLDDVSPAAEDEEVYGVRLRAAARRARRASLDRAAVVTAVSPALRDALVAEGVDPARIVLLPNGVDPATLEPDPAAADRRRALAPAEELVVLYAGSFQPFHRVDLLLEGFARASQRDRMRLVLVGDGDERPAAEDAAGALGVADRVTFAGRVAAAGVPGWLQAADVCVLAATAPYMSPMKVYEYLAAGRPVVVPDVGAVRQVTGDYDVAFWFADGDAAALGAALDAAAAAGARREAMGERARELARAETWDARAATLVAALTSRRGGPTAGRPPTPGTARRARSARRRPAP